VLFVESAVTFYLGAGSEAIKRIIQNSTRDLERDE
jgi:hypothetical protein